MSKKKLFAIIIAFIAYCFLLFYISITFKDSGKNSEIELSEGTEDVETAPSDLLSPEVFASANIEGKATSDTPWGSTIELLGADDSEQGLFMMPGTAISYTVSLPEHATLYMDAKIFDSIAQAGISDGVTLVVDLFQDGKSIHMFDPVVVSGNGQISYVEFDMSEWQEIADQITIRCYAGESGDAIGDWCVIQDLLLAEKAAMASSDLLSPEVYASADIEGQEEFDTPWGNTIELLGMDYPEQGLFMMPETAISYTVSVPAGAILYVDAKIYDPIAQLGLSDGVTLIVDIFLDGKSIHMFDPIPVSGDGHVSYQELDLSEWKGNTVQIKIRCFDGGHNDAAGDWCVIKELQLAKCSNFGKLEYVRAATYYGSEWPVNFWNSELESLNSDFHQISEDGFNSIIICIPWREFQTSVNPIEYNTYAFEKLDTIMQCAEECGLGVYARIGYKWDYYNDTNENIKGRYHELLYDETTIDAWLDYCHTLYEVLSEYKSFENGFITWEDFWGDIDLCDSADYKERRRYAHEVGYTDWVKQTYLLEEYNDSFLTNYRNFNDIPIPLRDEDPAMEAFYGFYDEWLSRLLRMSQENFPNLSMEVRLDWDNYMGSCGDLAFYEHSKTFSCENSDFTATMYGIPMGFENIGERVTAAEALEKTESVLSVLTKNNERKPVFIDQFLYSDNTPEYFYNAKINDDELDDYLEGVAEVLLRYSRGYGVWAYRNYRNNMLYNAQFALGENGWVFTGKPLFSETDGSKTCVLGKGDSISQHVPYSRVSFPEKEYICEIQIVETKGAVIEVGMGSESKEIHVTKTGLNKILLPINDSFDFCLSVIDGYVEIDNISLFSYIHDGCLYNEYNEKLDLINCIRSLNQKLEK